MAEFVALILDLGMGLLGLVIGGVFIFAFLISPIYQHIRSPKPSKDEQIAKLQNKLSQTEEERTATTSENSLLSIKIKELESELRAKETEISLLKSKIKEKTHISESTEKNSQPIYLPKYLEIPDANLYNKAFQEMRDKKAQEGKIHIIEIQGIMYSEYSKKKYTTSFVKCNCEDFIFQSRKNPNHICKHMVAFALEMKNLQNALSLSTNKANHNINSKSNEKKVMTSPILSSQTHVVDRLMAAIDEELNVQAPQHKSVDTLRSRIRIKIQQDYDSDPKKISDFANSIDYKLWALKMICATTFDALKTKRYFGENGLTPTGSTYYQLNYKCLETAYNCKYITQSEFNIALRNLNELVSCAGHTEFFRYKPKDNYLDFDED